MQIKGKIVWVETTLVGTIISYVKRCKREGRGREEERSFLIVRGGLPISLRVMRAERFTEFSCLLLFLFD